jgi:hypothetical protein
MGHGAGEDVPGLPATSRSVEAPISPIKPTPIKSGIQIFILLKNNQHVRLKDKERIHLFVFTKIFILFLPKTHKGRR